jgi:NitT/TauT family transport system ATP-binding protein
MTTETTDIPGFLRRTDLFRDVGEEVLGQIARLCREERYPRGATIYRTGDPPGDFYLLVDGRVDHPRVIPSGDPAAGVVGMPGDMFGFAAVVEHQRRRIFTTACLADSRVLAINGRDLVELLRRNQGAGFAVMQRLAATMARLEGHLVPRGGHLSVQKAGKIYDPEGVHVVAVEDCSIDIGAGEFCMVVGPSGCGKTTLLNTIAGFDSLTSGDIVLDGERIAAPALTLRPGADRIVVFQNGALFPWKTVLDNVTYGPVVQGKFSRRDAEASARELLEKVGLKGIETQYPGEISSGMRRRVEIVRALINDPRILLLDEPFRTLDALTKSVMHEHLLELYDMTKKTVFFITHDLEEAIFLADTVVVMTTRPGRVKTTVRVGIERPRSHQVLSSPEFLALKQEVIDAVHEEAVKAFQAGERELA